MLRLVRIFVWMNAGLGVLTSALCAQSQVTAPPFRPPTNTIPPTVTTAMGDVGGKFFGHPPDPARTRRYYIAIEPELWDYVPQGLDPVCGKPLPPPVLAQRRGGKIRYVQYLDGTFGAKAMQAPRLGILGPVLRGVVGDYLAVTVLNRTAQPFSMHPHGVKYDKDSEGAYYQPKPGLGAAIGPGARFTYIWHLDEESGPLPGEPSSKAWLYHSHVEGDQEAGLGLVGFIVVTDPRRARTDGTPADVDREHAALFMIFDESGLGAAEKEAAEYANTPNAPPAKPWAQVQEMLEAGARAAINGHIFGNLPGLEMNQGERVRWYLFALGSEEDFHTAHWHGLRVLEDGRRRTDNIELLPASMKVADMVADNPGSWLFHCHVTDHMAEGMFARVTVHPKESPRADTSPEQRYFGLRQQSLLVRRAEAAVDPQPGAAQPCELRLQGTITVFDAFSVFTQPVQVRIGDTAVTFKPDRKGQASVADNRWQVKNASQFGVVYGGLMEFEMELSGADWAGELQKLGLEPGATSARTLNVPMTLQVGVAQHAATVEVACRIR
jgi:hypothetical protein